MAATRFRLSHLFSNNWQLISVRLSANLHQQHNRQHHICAHQIIQYKSSRFFGGHDSCEYLHENLIDLLKYYEQGIEQCELRQKMN